MKPSKYATYQEASEATIKLGINSRQEYMKRYKEDSQLPSCPDKEYKNNGWVSWYLFLGKENRISYETYQEAHEAVLKLNISRGVDYRRRYKEDSRLPSCPDKEYKNNGWVSWVKFFGKEKEKPYNSYQEAKAATIALDINDTREYSKRYKDDLKLPNNPAKVYKNKGWIDWPDYFGHEVLEYIDAIKVMSTLNIVRKSVYSKQKLRELKLPLKPEKSYKEYYDWASFTSQVYIDPLDALNLIESKGGDIKSESAYLALQELYPSLPLDPVKFYGFDSFNHFVSFSEENLWNVEQVKTFCAEHKIQSRDDYDLAALKTPYLAKNCKKIPNFTTMNDFLFKPSPFDVFQDTDHIDWVNVADKWLQTISGALDKKRFLIKSFYQQHSTELPPSPQTACSVNYPFPDINPWIKALSDTSRNLSSVNLIENFFDFIIEHHCSVRDGETGELITLEGYTNPISKTELMVKFHKGSPRSETNKDALPFRYIHAARDYLIPQKADPMFNNFKDLYDRLIEKTDLYDNSAEWFEVDSEVIDKNDSDCVWKKENGKIYIWSPVRLMAVYTQLFMPFRGSQICWLDSGEADQRILVEVDGKFIWQDNVLFPNHRVPAKVHQGFLIPRDSQTTIGCHVNTNKTAKNAHEGYTVPWVDERIIPWMIRLRDWQIKYNPIEDPTWWTDLGRKDKSEEDFEKYGHNGRTCFLFRDPTKPALQRFRPLSQPKLSDGFCALLYLIQEDELPLACLKKGRKATAINNFFAHFSLHSMRVSLITAFIRDAKIAPEIVQKLVGHSSIVMTIYYTKVADEEIREVLMNAESFIIKNQEKRLQQLIRQREMEQVQSELIGADGELVGAKFDGPAAAFIFMDAGICPMGRTRCDDGGEPINSDTSRYAPVTAGYLGRSNCLQCRHFATGPAFLGGLQLLSNEISLECKASADIMEKLSEKVDVLSVEQYQAKKANQIFTHSHELSLATSHQEQEQMRFDSLTCDLISAIRFFLNSVSLLNKKIQSKKTTKDYALVVQDESNAIEAQVSEVSNFIHLDMVCQSASYFQSSRPKNASLQRTQILDLFAQKNGLSPNMFALSEEQQLAIGNEMTQMLRARVGTWDKVDELMDKESDISLQDLGIKLAETEDLKMLFEGKSLKERQLVAPSTKLKIGIE